MMKKGMRWVRFLAGAVGAGTIFTGGPALGFRTIQEGSAAPALSLSATDGASVSLEGLRGKAVVLAFVRQGQDRSRDALVDLAKLAPRLGSDATVLAVVVNPGDGDAAAWAKEAGATFPVLLDQAGEVYAAYGVLVAPSTGVIAADGTFRGEVPGHSAGYGADVERLVHVAQGKAVAEEAEAAAPGAGKSDERKLAERHLEQARVLVKRKMPDKALPAAREAAKVDPGWAEPHVLIGELLLQQATPNPDEAMAEFDAVLKIAPNDPGAKAGLAQVKSLKGDYEGAVALLDEAARLNPKPEKLYYQLGRVHEQAGQYQKAVEAYRKALERLLH